MSDYEKLSREEKVIAWVMATLAFVLVCIVVDSVLF